MHAPLHGPKKPEMKLLLMVLLGALVHGLRRSPGTSLGLRTRSNGGALTGVRLRGLATKLRAYQHLDTEKKWQEYWDENNIFEATRRPGHKKKYVLDMFPYPSGAGLHVGHPEGYTATDIMSRYWRMND